MKVLSARAVSSLRLLVAVFVGGVMVTGTAGCGDRGGAGDDERTIIHTYQVRGRIVELPGEGPGEELRIHHEAIDDFRDSSGEIDPMPPMVMPFPPAADVSLAEIEVGDEVLATVEVQWEPEAGWMMTDIEKLPEGTRLEFDAPEQGQTHDAHEH